MKVATLLAFVLTTCLPVNAVDDGQAMLNDMQVQLDALNDLVRMQARRINQLENGAMEADAKYRRLNEGGNLGKPAEGGNNASPSFGDRQGVTINSDRAWLTMGTKKDFKVVYTSEETATIYGNVNIAGQLNADTIHGNVNVVGELRADSIKVGDQSLTDLILSLRDAVLSPDGRILQVAESCKAHLAAGETTSGLYPVGTKSKQHLAWCDQETNGGGWELVLNRVQAVGDTTTNDPVTPETKSKALSDDNWASLQGTFTEVMAFSPSDGAFTATTVSALSDLGSCQDPFKWPPESLTRSPIAQYETDNCHGSGSDHAHWFGVAYYPGHGIIQYSEKEPGNFGYAPTQNTRVTDYNGHFGITWGKGAEENVQMFMLVR